MSWLERAYAGHWPARIVGGVPLERPPVPRYPCPDCDETFPDPMVAFAHLMTHVQDRQAAKRRMLNQQEVA